MKYVSTRGQAEPIGFLDAVLAGLAPDGGLYIPETWPTFTQDEIAAFHGRWYRPANLVVAAAGGWLAIRLSGSLLPVFAMQGVALAVYGIVSATAIAGGAWSGPVTRSAVGRDARGT